MANSGGHSQERWLLTRKTWRYMADAGRKLIPESVRNTNDPASIQQIEQNFQELCRKEKSFLLWRRTKNERVQCSAPTSPLPLSLDTSEDDITVIEKRARDGDSSPCEPLFDLEHYGASVEAYQRRATYPRPYKNSPRSSAAYDLSEAEPVQCHLEEDSRLVTIGSIEDLLGEDGRRRAVRHIGVQTETCLIDPLTHHPLEIDSGKCTEGEFSSPEALSPLSMIDIRAESFRSPTSTTSGVSSAGMTVECTSPPEALRKDSMIQANLPPTEFELLKEEERPLSIDEEPDKFADKLSKYFKMARRDSVTRTKDKKDRFKTVNYDKTLRNIKSKRVNPDTLEDTSEDVKPLDIDEIIRQARLESPPSVVSPVPAQPHPVKKKKKRRGIQVGEPLPQYILDSLRNVFSSFRPIRKLSKTESDASAECSSDPLSPRYSIAVSDGTLHRDPLSDVESPLGALSPTSSTRNSVDPTQDPHDRFISSELTAFDPLGNIILSSSPPPDTTFPTSSDHDITPSREYPSFPPHSSHPIQTFFARRLSSVRTPSLSHQSLQQSHRRSKDSGQGGQSTSSSEQIDARAGVTADGKRSGFLSTVMRTGRGASSTVSSGASSNSSNSRGTTKRLWRMRSKSQSRSSLTSVCLWTPQEGQQWSDIQNRLVVLPSCQLQQLCPVEATLLRQLAVEKLAEMNLGYPVRVPKEDGSPPPATKPKRRQKAISRKHAGIFDLSRKDESGGKNRTSGMVFGISLTKCLENDRLLGRSVTSDLTCVDEHVTCRQSRAASHSSCSSWAATDQRGRGSCDSIDRSEKRPSLEESSLTFTHLDRCESLTVQPVQVPRFVDACIKHIDRHGLNTIGIFRVSSSKKRSRQLRDEFDTGKDIELEEDCCPHVVATLLKEFLRDMERPLLPHELYAPFLATQRVRNRRQQLEMMQWLLRLLPPANRDTLSVLLSFLKRVADCSADRRNSAGDWLTGNRMDSSNLATLFAPNVLHSLAQATAGIVAAVKSGGGGSGGGNGGGCGEQAAAHTAERIDAINVFRSLIDCHGKLFQVSSEDLHSVYLVMMERNPEYLDVLLRRRYAGPTSPEQGSPTIAFQQTSAKNAPLRANSIPSTEFEYRNNSAQQLMESCPLYKEDTPPPIPGVNFSPSSQAGTNILIEKPKQGVIGNIGRRAEKFSPTQGAKWLRRRVRSCHGAKRRSIDETSGISSYTWFRKRDKSTGSCCSDSSGESSECRHRRSSVPHITSTEGVGRSTRRQRNTRPANKDNPHRHRSSSSDLEPQSTLSTTILNATLRVTMSSPSSNFQKTQSSARSPGVWPADSEWQRAPAGGTSRVTETRVATEDVEDTFTCSLRIQPVVSGEASRNVRCGDHWRDLVALESPCSTSKQPARLPDEQEQWNEDAVSPSLANNGDTIDVINTSDSNVLTDEVYSIFSSQAGNECRIGASSSLYHQCSTIYHQDKHARELSFPHPELATTDQGINNTQRQTRQIDTLSSTSARKGRARKSASVEPGSCPSASGTPRIATNSQTVHLWKRHEIISSACDTST